MNQVDLDLRKAVGNKAFSVAVDIALAPVVIADKFFPLNGRSFWKALAVSSLVTSPISVPLIIAGIIVYKDLYPNKNPS